MGLFSNIMEGSAAGALVGGAIETILCIGATATLGPAGLAMALAAAPEVTGIGAAIGSGAGIAAGVGKTIYESCDDDM